MIFKVHNVAFEIFIYVLPTRGFVTLFTASFEKLEKRFNLFSLSSELFGFSRYHLPFD